MIKRQHSFEADPDEFHRAGETDERANISMAGKDPFDEALDQARRVRRAGIRSLVVDTDLTWIHSYAYTRVLAETLGARCLGLEELELGRVVDFLER